MLRNCLSCGGNTVSHSESTPQLEHRLSILQYELVKDDSPGSVREGLVHIAHNSNDRQVRTCLSRFKTFSKVLTFE